MAQPTLKSVRCLRPEGFRRMAYVDWGAADNPDVVVCVHGLSRNGRDFDALARALSDRYRVVCPDVLGRGRSDWLSDPDGYDYQGYLADMATLIGALDVDGLAWIGSSMGGLIGMFLAAAPGSPVERLVMNDIGPYVPAAAMAAIKTYLGKAPSFGDMGDAEAYLRTIHAPFGALSDDDWRHMTEHSVRRDDDGRLGLRYDPAIAGPIEAMADEDVDLWAFWPDVSQPTLALRGADSTLFTADIAQRLRDSREGVTLETFPGCGHAPALRSEAQIKTILRWLESDVSHAASV